jgi:hypothetical protein
VEEKRQMIKVEILFDETTGAVNINGPIDNPILIYGLLEIAKDICRKHVSEKTAIIRPTMVMPSNIKQ